MHEGRISKLVIRLLGGVCALYVMALAAQCVCMALVEAGIR